jgi:hypothetical protein
MGYAIARSKEKSTLSPNERDFYLNREKEEKQEDVHKKMRELRRRIDDEGYCPTCEEEEQLEEYLQER